MAITEEKKEIYIYHLFIFIGLNTLSNLLQVKAS